MSKPDRQRRPLHVRWTDVSRGPTRWLPAQPIPSTACDTDPVRSSFQRDTVLCTRTACVSNGEQLNGREPPPRWRAMPEGRRQARRSTSSVCTVQDDYPDPVERTSTTAFTQYGSTDLNIQAGIAQPGSPSGGVVRATGRSGAPSGARGGSPIAVVG